MSAVWGAIKFVLHEDSRNKFVFLGSDYQESLQRIISKENIPIEFGGDADIAIKRPLSEVYYP